MDKKILKAATDAMRELGLSEIRIKDADTEVVLKRELTASPAVAAPVTVPVAATSAAAPAQETGASIAAPADWAEVKSPLIGVFYAAASPDADPYVRIGDKVKRGDVLCIVEAMKMMNEICAETDGTVIDICAENGALVEYGQLLFKIAEAE